MKNEIANLGNRVEQMEERISDIKDRNLEMTQMEEEKDLRVKEIKELYKNFLSPSERAI